MARKRWLLFLALLPCPALAEYRHFAWTYAASTGEEGQTGLETWVTSLFPDLERPRAQGWSVWWGATSSLTEQDELALFAVAGQAGSAGLSFSGLHAQWRRRLVGPLSAVGDLVLAPGGRADHPPGGMLFAVLGQPLGERLHLGVNLGAGYSYLAPTAQVDAAVGATVRLGELVHLQAEAFSHYFPEKGYLVLYAGPGVELVKGRFWVTANVAFGVDGGAAASCTRVIFGLQL